MISLDETKLTSKAETVSCFLPSTQIQFAWDSTSLGMLKTCPRLYQYTMLDGWGSREESIHLRFGIEFHSAMESFDRHRAEGRFHDDAVAHIIHETLLRIRDWDPDVTTRAGNYKNPRTLISLIIDHADFYRTDAAKTHILKDGTPAVELSFRFELDWGPTKTYMQDEEGPAYFAQPYLLCGHIDRVVDFVGELYALDYKTTITTPGQYYFAQYSPNNQMTLYTLASKVIMNTPVKGVMIEAAQIKLEGPNEFKRGFAFRTESQLEEWLSDLRFWLGQAEAFANAGYWPMNDTSCDKFGGCRFRDVCAKDPAVRPQFLKAKFDKLEPEERWNPLKAR